MTIWHDEYRHYRISYQGDRRAIIAQPDSEAPLPDVIEVDLGQGRTELRARAHMAIDADIANARAVAHAPPAGLG